MGQDRLINSINSVRFPSSRVDDQNFCHIELRLFKLFFFVIVSDLKFFLKKTLLMIVTRIDLELSIREIQKFEIITLPFNI